MQQANITKGDIRANYVPDSYRAEDGTIEVTFASESPVLRYDWAKRQFYNEILDITAESMKTERLADAGIPFLRDHYPSVENVIGRVLAIRLEGRKAIATIRLSNTERDADVVEKIKSGLVAGISVGYRVNKYKEDKPAKYQDGRQTEPAIWRATDWDVQEISAVAVAADPVSGVRSENSEKFIVNIETEPKQMATENLDGVRNEPKPNPPAPEIDLDAIRKEERARAAAIEKVGMQHALGSEWVRSMIEGNLSIADVKARALDEIAARTTRNNTPAPNPIASGGGDDRQRQFQRASMEAAMMMRMGYHTSDIDKLDHETRGEAERMKRYGFTDMAKICLENAGVDTRRLPQSEILTKALGNSSVRSGGIASHSTDFPILLASILRRTVLAAYQIQPYVWRKFCRVAFSADFREQYRMRMGTFGGLKEIKEGGTYPIVSMNDASQEKIKVSTYGAKVGITRFMLANDDMQGFADRANQLGQAAARQLELLFFAVLKANPTMSDGTAWIHASHDNLTSPGTYPTTAALEALRKKMKLKKNKDKTDFINVEPAMILCSPSLYLQFKRLNENEFSIENGTPTGLANSVRGMFREIVESPYMEDSAFNSGLSWFAFANPTIAPALEMLFMDTENPFMAEQEDFNSDGFEMKIRIDAGCAPIDWTPVNKNLGAAS